MIRMNQEYFFISKPRCASTHLYEGLTNWNDKTHGNKPFYHITANQMKNVFKEKYKNSFSFSVIRHPYELVLSWYNEHRKPRYEQSVKDFYNISVDEWITKDVLLIGHIHHLILYINTNGYMIATTFYQCHF